MDKSAMNQANYLGKGIIPVNLYKTNNVLRLLLENSNDIHSWGLTVLIPLFGILLD